MERPVARAAELLEKQKTRLSTRTHYCGKKRRKSLVATFGGMSVEPNYSIFFKKCHIKPSNFNTRNIQ